MLRALIMVLKRPMAGQTLDHELATGSLLFCRLNADFTVGSKLNLVG